MVSEPETFFASSTKLNDPLTDAVNFSKVFMLTRNPALRKIVQHFFADPDW